MLDAFVLSLVSNYNLGLLILFLLGAGLLIWGIFLDRINQGKHRKIAIWLQGLAITGLAVALGISLFLLIYGSVDTADGTEDAVIVLGAGIRGDQVTLTLQYRLDACLDYIEQNPEALIVVSGGQGPQETTTEAKAMERYLIRKGVDPNKIIKEERASSTIENFQFSKQLLDERLEKPYTIVLVTNDFHIYRAHQYAKMAGFQDPRQLHGPLEWYLGPVTYAREVLAVLKFWILD